jgi:hypothetical protein
MNLMDQSKSNKRSKYESYDDSNQENQNHFVELPVEILLMIFFNSYQKKCNQKHQWCSCDIINHQYDKNQTIFRLIQVCKSWHNIIGQIIQRKIILNQHFLDSLYWRSEFKVDKDSYIINSCDDKDCDYIYYPNPRFNKIYNLDDSKIEESLLFDFSSGFESSDNEIRRSKRKRSDI